MYEALSSILKTEETPDSISFNMEELEDLATGLISRIQDASEEHDHALFKQLVYDYLINWKKSQPEKEGDDEEAQMMKTKMKTQTMKIREMMMMAMTARIPHQARIQNLQQLDKNEDSEGDEPPPQKGQEGFCRMIHFASLK